MDQTNEGTTVAEAVVCRATNQTIDNGAPCKYLAGHLDAGIPHTTANGFWWTDAPAGDDERGPV